MTLTTQIDVNVAAALASALDLANAESTLKQKYGFGLASGTGANQADKVFHDQRTLAASASEELDLAGGLTDALGAALTFVKVKALIVKAAAGNTNDVVVGGAAANGFATPFADASDKVNVKPGGILALVAPGAGYTVTAGTGDLLKIANSAGGSGVTYDIIVIGTSA